MSEIKSKEDILFTEIKKRFPHYGGSDKFEEEKKTNGVVASALSAMEEYHSQFNPSPSISKEEVEMLALEEYPIVERRIEYNNGDSVDVVDENEYSREVFIAGFNTCLSMKSTGSDAIVDMEKIRFVNTSAGNFKCVQVPRFRYRLERNGYSVKAKVFDGDRVIVEFETNFTAGWFFIFLFKGEEGNMSFAFKKAHKKSKAVIKQSIKHGC